jgi:diguanylate cyclase (GGDEF)-like protein
MARRTQSWRWKDCILGAMALLMLGAAYTSVLIVRRQTALAAMSRYNLTWLVSQAGLEVSRLYGTVAASLVPGSGIDEDELDLRLSIVENRLEILRSGEIAEFIRASPDLTAIVSNFQNVITEARKELTDSAGPHRTERLMHLTSSLNTPIARLAAAANAYSADMEAKDRRDLNTLHWLFSAILATITVCGLALVVAMTWHNRLLARAQAQAERQNAALLARDMALRTRNQQFDAALNNMSQALCMIDATGLLTVCNVRFTELFKLGAKGAYLGRQAKDVFADIAGTQAYHPSMIGSIMLKQARFAEDRVSVSFTEEDEAGRALAVSQVPMADGGWVSTFEDITERRRTEAQVRHMAHHDALTDLPNRVWFHDKLSEALVQYEADGAHVALLCLDLDQFKQVNDVYGHPFGDQLLQMVGGRLEGCVRDCDVVARLGGDEFAILQLGSAQPDAAQTTAHRIVRALGEPYEIDGQHIVIGASVGVAVPSAPSVMADALLKEADIALYRAKSNGRGTYCVYEEAMGSELRARRQMETDLRSACAAGELKVFYQPIFALEPNQVCGFEALLRWDHPQHGMIPPGVFIPIAEEAGLIGAIGQWVLERACSDAASWPVGLKVAVNLSPMQVSSPGLAAIVEQALAQSGLAAARLELEITESALLNNSHAVLATLRELSGLGLRLVLDDFGTGYSSLSYLHAFPFSKVKIDRSFVHHMAPQSHSEAIVRAVISLATCLGMTTTAEGVETHEQLDRLRQAGCTEIQGFLIDRPQPLSVIGRWFPVRPPLLQLVASG